MSEEEVDEAMRELFTEFQERALALGCDAFMAGIMRGEANYCSVNASPVNLCGLIDTLLSKNKRVFDSFILGQVSELLDREPVKRNRQREH